MEGGNLLHRTQFDCLLFDLDDTLYSSSTGMATACRKNIDEFLSLKLASSIDVVTELRSRFYKTYGSSLAGLRALGYEIDADEYHSFVHGRLPYEVIKPDPVLRNILLSMPQRKLIFTNSDRVHATKILKKLCLEDCFEDVICFESLNADYPYQQQDGEENPLTSPVTIKPSVEAFRRAIAIAKSDPQRTLFFDDNRRNIAGAKGAGLNTVFVGSSEKSEGADYVVEDIHNVKHIVHEIWGEAENYRAPDKNGCSTGIAKSIEVSPTPVVA
ncbi:uncharacterized protein C24B11.05 [Cryptomeria japonica]|uniref:uncharacterized protein C24B11.05 n=1 Tax=Cryptomeria japonica TaxID=3369 RepID=UPI0025ABC66D|nr:uncharacterized protein C24B11.05 [Cryptomeria japonica]